MVQSYKTLVESYASQGLLNKEAFEVREGKLKHIPSTAFDEFALDACTYVNEHVGFLIHWCNGKINTADEKWDASVHTAVEKAAQLWETKGCHMSDDDVKLCYRRVSNYVADCFTARVRRMFRTDTEQRGRLYASMARRGLSRTQCRDALEGVLANIYATHKDGEYTDTILDGYVTEYFAYL